MSRIAKGNQFRIKWQSGVAAVEFAVVSILLFTVLFGIMEMGRMLYYWNSAAEATRLGARLAVVCDPIDKDNIKTKMTKIFPALPISQIEINYLNPPFSPNTCTANSCKSVEAKILPFSQQLIIPFIDLTLTLPSFSTFLPRESMTSNNNSVCAL